MHPADRMHVNAQPTRYDEKSSFLSREKANSIAAKYLDKLPLKTGEWIMERRCQNAPKVGGYTVAFKLFS